MVRGVIVLDEFGPQPQTGDRGAQIVADCRQHLSSIVDEAADAAAHRVEGAGHGHHLLRPVPGQRHEVHARAEGIGGLGEFRQRSGQGPRRPDRHERQGDAEEDEGEDDRAGAERRPDVIRQGRAQARTGRRRDADPDATGRLRHFPRRREIGDREGPSEPVAHALDYGMVGLPVPSAGGGSFRQARGRFELQAGQAACRILQQARPIPRRSGIEQANDGGQPCRGYARMVVPGSRVRAASGRPGSPPHG